MGMILTTCRRPTRFLLPEASHSVENLLFATTVSSRDGMLQQGSELLCGGPSSASCTEPCCPSSPEPQASPATYTQHEKQHVDPETSFRDC